MTFKIDCLEDLKRLINSVIFPIKLPHKTTEKDILYDGDFLNLIYEVLVKTLVERPEFDEITRIFNDWCNLQFNQVKLLSKEIKCFTKK